MKLYTRIHYFNGKLNLSNVKKRHKTTRYLFKHVYPPNITFIALIFNIRARLWARGWLVVRACSCESQKCINGAWKNDLNPLIGLFQRKKKSFFVSDEIYNSAKGVTTDGKRRHDNHQIKMPIDAERNEINLKWIKNLFWQCNRANYLWHMKYQTPVIIVSHQVIQIIFCRKRKRKKWRHGQNEPGISTVLMIEFQISRQEMSLLHRETIQQT